MADPSLINQTLMTTSDNNKKPQHKPKEAKKLPMTPIFAASGTTILGVKINRPLTIVAKKKFLQHCKNEAGIIVTSILIGYLQWCDSKNSAVTILPPLMPKNAPKKDDKEQRLEQQLIEKLKNFHQFAQETEEDPPAVPTQAQIDIPDNIHHHPNAFVGTLFDQKTKTISDYIGEQPHMVTSELDPLTPKRWRPLFMHNHNAPWGWPLKDENLKHLPPKGFGPLIALPAAKQQIFGMVHGCCLCFHRRESKPQITQLEAYEWPTFSRNISASNKSPRNKSASNKSSDTQSSDKPSWCLGCALYLSAIGYLCPSIHLSPIPSWVAPRESLIPISVQLDPQLLKNQSSSFQFQLFKANMHSWMVDGLKMLNKKHYRSRLKNISRTAKGKMIIPLMLKKLNTTISDESITPLLDAALLFEDALTLPIELSALLNQVIAKLKGK